MRIFAVQFAASMPHLPLFPPDAFIDFHTHRARYGHRADVHEVISVHLGEGKEGDYYTLGSHPWLTPNLLTAEQLHTIERTLLDDPRCLALGECGLDKLKGPDLHVQLAILEQLLDIADRHGRSVVIHCVRAYDPLLKVKRNFPRIPYWAVHGYARHDVLAKTLVDQGFHLSLAPERSSHAGLLATVKALPQERLFLETDSAHWQDIVDVYNFVAEWRGIPLPELQATIAENCKTFFQK